MDQPIIAWGGQTRRENETSNEIDASTIQNIINPDGLKKAVVDIRVDNFANFNIDPLNNIAGDALAQALSALLINPLTGDSLGISYNDLYNAITSTSIPIRLTSTKFNFDLRNITTDEQNTVVLDLENANVLTRLMQIWNFWKFVEPYIFPLKKPVLRGDLTYLDNTNTVVTDYLWKLTGNMFDKDRAGLSNGIIQNPYQWPLYNDVKIDDAGSTTTVKKDIIMRSWKQVSNSNEVIRLPQNYNFSNIFFGGGDQYKINYDGSYLNLQKESAGAGYTTPLKVDASNAYILNNMNCSNITASNSITVNSNITACNIITACNSILAASNVTSDRVRVSQAGIGTQYSEFTYDGTTVLSSKPITSTSNVTSDRVRVSKVGFGSQYSELSYDGTTLLSTQPITSTSNITSDRIRVSQVGIGSQYSEFTYDGSNVVSSKPIKASVIRVDGAANGICDISQTTTGLTFSSNVTVQGNLVPTKIGIGTTSPSADLHLSGKTLKVGDTYNGTTLFVDSSNVGIGTSAGTGGAKLQVSGDISSTNTITAQTFQIKPTTGAGGTFAPFGESGCYVNFAGGVKVSSLQSGRMVYTDSSNVLSTDTYLVYNELSNVLGAANLKYIGNGSNITNLNAANISTGTVPVARLPDATATTKGISMIIDSVQSTSITDAAAPNAVKIAYDKASTNASNVQNLQNRMNTAESNITKNTSDISSANSNISKAQTDISKNASDISAANSNISKAQTDISKNTSDISAANSNITKNASDISSANSNISKAQSDISAANSNISKAQSDISANTSNINKAQAGVDAATSNVNDLKNKSAGWDAAKSGWDDFNSNSSNSLRKSIADEAKNSALSGASDILDAANNAKDLAQTAANNATSAANSAITAGIAAGTGAISGYVTNLLSDYCTNSRASDIQSSVNGHATINYAYGNGGNKYAAYMLQAWLDNKWLTLNTDGGQDFVAKFHDQIEYKLNSIGTLSPVGIGTTGVTGNALTVYGNTQFIQTAPQTVTLPMVSIRNSTSSLPSPFNGSFGYAQSSQNSGSLNAGNAFQLDGVTNWWRGTGVYNNNNYSSNADGNIRQTSNIDGSNVINGEYIDLILPSTIPFNLTGYKLICLASRTDSPQAWTILGSNNSGSTWTTLDVKTGVSSDNITYTSITGPRLPFTRFRFIVQRIRTSTTTSNAPIIAEWTLTGFVSSYTQPQVSATITAAANPEDPTKFNVFGSMALGSTYGNSNVAPNNLIIEGNVGIGSASPSQKLDVNGSVKATAFIGDGSQLSNLAIPTTFTNGTFSGTVTASNFIGNGSLITNISASNLPSTLNPTTFTGTVTASNFIGGGSGITGFTASQIPSTLNATTFNGNVTASNFVGNGSGITGLTASQIPSTLNATTFSGAVVATSFSGDGSALTNLNVNSTNGTITNTLTTSNIVASNVAIGSTTTNKARLYMNYVNSTVPLFLIEDATAPDTTPLCITSNGNLGVGLSNPSQKLYVNGTSFFNGNSVVNGTLTTSNTITGTSANLSVTGTASNLVANNYLTIGQPTFCNAYNLFNLGTSYFGDQVKLNKSSGIALDVNAQTVLRSNTQIYSTLGVSDVATLSSNVIVGGTTQITGNTGIGTAVDSNYKLRIEGKTLQGGDLLVTGSTTTNGFLNVANQLTATSFCYFNGTNTFNGPTIFNVPIKATSVIETYGQSASNVQMWGYTFSSNSNFSSFDIYHGGNGNTLSNGPLSYSNCTRTDLTSYTSLTGTITTVGTTSSTRTLTITPMGSSYKFLQAYYWENVSDFLSGATVNGAGLMVMQFSNPDTGLTVFLNGNKVYSNPIPAGTSVSELVVPIGGAFSIMALVDNRTNSSQPIQIKYYIFN